MSTSHRRLEGKVALVTGGAKRIGRSIALRLAEEGARVAIHFGQSQARSRRRPRSSARGRLCQADLAEVSEIRRLFEEVEAAYGRLDCLVNNAWTLPRNESAGGHRGRLGLDSPGEPEGHIFLLPVRRAAHAQARRREDRQSELAGGLPRLETPCPLLLFKKPG